MISISFLLIPADGRGVVAQRQYQASLSLVVRGVAVRNRTPLAGKGAAQLHGAESWKRGQQYLPMKSPLRTPLGSGYVAAAAVPA